MSKQDLPLIVVGVDGSEDGLRAVRFGASVAKEYGAELLLVHAVDDSMLAGAWGVVYDPEVLQEAGVTANEQAKALARELGLADDRLRAEVVLGSPGGVLSRLSELADLVVVGRRSVSGLERMFVGSTSVSVVANAACPVVVISGAAHNFDVGSKGLVGVGLNTNPGNQGVLEAGFTQARRLSAALEVVHVVQPPLGLFGPKMSPDDLEEQLRYIRGGIGALIAPVQEKFSDVEHEVVVIAGTPINELVARSAHYDGLVVGVGDGNMGGFGLGGLLRGLMAHAECPLYVAR